MLSCIFFILSTVFLGLPCCNGRTVTLAHGAWKEVVGYIPVDRQAVQEKLDFYNAYQVTCGGAEISPDTYKQRMAENFDFYYFPISPPSRTIHLLLELVNAPYKAHLVDMFKDEHKKPEYLAINPFHKVPHLVHGDFSLSESTAIARYIISNVKCEDHWYPADSKKRARVDEFLAYYPNTIRKMEIKVAYAFYFTEYFFGKKETEEGKQAALKKFDDALAEFEGYFLKRGPFIAGDKISIADLFALSEILNANMSNRDYLEGRPKVKEWLERVKAATKPHFEEVFRPLDEFVKTL